MSSSKRILWIALLAPMIAWPGTAGLSASQREERTFKVSGIPSVTVRNVSGNIEVTTWKQAEVKVEAAKSSEYVAVEMSQVGDNIRIVTKSQARGFGVFATRGSVDYFITMPAEGNLEANTISGRVSVENLRGDILVETVSGDLDLRRLGKRLWGRCVSGDVVLSQGQVDVDLTTVSGDVTISDVEGRLALGSVSGNLRILRAEAPRVSLSTTSGDVELDTTLVKGGGYRITSHSGYIGLYVSKNASFELSASTFSGELETDLQLTITTPESGRRHGRSVRGTYGSGEASIDLQTFSGDIRIISK